MKDNDNEKPSKPTQQVAQHLADLANEGADLRARRMQKEAYFRQSLGIRLQVPKKEEDSKPKNPWSGNLIL